MSGFCLSLSLTSNDSCLAFLTVVALMSGRKEKEYTRLFDALEEHAVRLKMHFDPQRVTTDFEGAMIATVASKVCESLFL